MSRRRRVQDGLVTRGWVFWLPASVSWLVGVSLAITGSYTFGVVLVLLAGAILISYLLLLRRRARERTTGDAGAEQPSILDLFG